MSEITPITYIILEDAYYTALDICNTIKRINPQYQLIGITDRISKAVEIIYSKNPDMMIADTITGEGETIAKLTKYPIEIPIIFISESGENICKDSSLNIVDFILKPVSPQDLANAFRHLHDILKKKNKQTQNICL